MSGNEADEVYRRLLIEFNMKGYTDPKDILDNAIKSFMDDGRTREQAILEIWKTESPKIQQREIEHNIEQCREKIKRLAVLYSKGEISEESYKDSVNAIEEDIKRLGSGVIEYRVPPIHICTQCKKEFTGTRCPYCDTEAPFVTPKASVSIDRSYYYPEYTKPRPSALWYLVPFFFGLLGGIMGYVAVKDQDEKMASSLLIGGIVLQILYIFIIIVIWSSVFYWI